MKESEYSVYLEGADALEKDAQAMEPEIRRRRNGIKYLRDSLREEESREGADKDIIEGLESFLVDYERAYLEAMSKKNMKLGVAEDLRRRDRVIEQILSSIHTNRRTAIDAG